MLLIPSLALGVPLALLGLALLVAVIRADKKDLPKMVNALARAFSRSQRQEVPRNPSRLPLIHVRAAATGADNLSLSRSDQLPSDEQLSG